MMLTAKCTYVILIGVNHGIGGQESLNFLWMIVLFLFIY